MDTQRARRNTRQRKVILKVVEELGCHPTAEAVFDEVRKVLPKTSLSTVYRNLGILSDQGEIACLTGSGREVHYDHNTSEHCHIECMECGRICDVDVYPVRRELLEPDRLSGFRLLEINVNLSGVCPECRKKLRRKED